MVFPDICNDKRPYEEWYIHPDLIDVGKATALCDANKYKKFKCCGKSIGWKDLEYPPA